MVNSQPTKTVDLIEFFVLYEQMDVNFLPIITEPRILCIFHHFLGIGYESILALLEQFCQVGHLRLARISASLRLDISFFLFSSSCISSGVFTFSGSRSDGASIGNPQLSNHLPSAVE